MNMKKKRFTFFQFLFMLSGLALLAALTVYNAPRKQTRDITLASGPVTVQSGDLQHPLLKYFQSDEFKAEVSAYLTRSGADQWSDAQAKKYWEDSSTQMREEARWASFLDSLLYANRRLHNKSIPKKWQELSSDIMALNVLANTLGTTSSTMNKLVKTTGESSPMKLEHASQVLILPRMKQLRLRVTYDVMNKIYKVKKGSPFLRPWENDPEFVKQAP